MSNGTGLNISIPAIEHQVIYHEIAMKQAKEKVEYENKRLEVKDGY